MGSVPILPLQSSFALLSTQANQGGSQSSQGLTHS
jgi:hypothetical protein